MGRHVYGRVRLARLTARVPRRAWRADADRTWTRFRSLSRRGRTCCTASPLRSASRQVTPTAASIAFSPSCVVGARVPSRTMARRARDAGCRRRRVVARATGRVARDRGRSTIDCCRAGARFRARTIRRTTCTSATELALLTAACDLIGLLELRPSATDSKGRLSARPDSSTARTGTSQAQSNAVSCGGIAW